MFRSRSTRLEKTESGTAAVIELVDEEASFCFYIPFLHARTNMSKMSRSKERSRML